MRNDSLASISDSTDRDASSVYPGRMRLRSKITALFVALLMGTGGAIAIGASPAAAQVIGCGSEMCFGNGSAGRLSSYPSNYPRNLCINVSSQTIETYENNTQYVWFGFHTSNCSGSHIEFHAGLDGGMLGSFGSTWDAGQMHGVFRTSTVG